MGQPTLHGLYPYINPQTHTLFIIEGHFISNAYTAQLWSFPIFWLQIWWVPLYEMLDGWIVLALGSILNVIGDRIISVAPIWGSLFLI